MQEFLDIHFSHSYTAQKYRYEKSHKEEKIMTESNETAHTKRRHPRAKANVHYRPTKVIGQKHLVPNISLGGMRIFSNTHFKKGETANIELSFSDGQKTIVLARVAWVDAYPKDSDFIYEFGLEFIHVPEHIMDKLKLELENV